MHMLQRRAHMARHSGRAPVLGGLPALRRPADLVNPAPADCEVRCITPVQSDVGGLGGEGVPGGGNQEAGQAERRAAGVYRAHKAWEMTL